ncbi:MAG: c-type cytochrome [Snowella sp.]|nr:c-type cytochrome [Snowella sp.]
MKKLLTFLILTLSIATLIFNQPALAADVAHGGQIFSAKCASCHLGGGNVIDANKTLQKGALVSNGKDTAEAIIAQVTNGKNAMPKFSGQLSPEDIQDVAAYVLEKAANDWK